MMNTRNNTCPLSTNNGNNCAPMACSCGSVNITLCRALFRAYCYGCKEATERINAKAKEKREETPDFLNKKFHIGVDLANKEKDG